MAHCKGGLSRFLYDVFYKTIDLPDHAAVPPQARELDMLPLQSQFRNVDGEIVGVWLGVRVGEMVKERGEVAAGVTATVGARVGMPAMFENEFINAHAALASL